MDIHCSRALLCLGHYISVKFYALSSNLRERERHHEPTGAAGLDEKKPNWIQHQGAILLHSPSYKAVQKNQDSCSRTPLPPLQVCGAPPSHPRTRGAREVPSLGAGLQDNPVE